MSEFVVAAGGDTAAVFNPADGFDMIAFALEAPACILWPRADRHVRSGDPTVAEKHSAV